MTDMKLESQNVVRQNAQQNSKAKKFTAIQQAAMMNAETVLLGLDSHSQGLTQEDASLRLARIGRNEVAHEQAPSVLLQLLMAFNNPFIYVLMALAVVSVITEYVIPLRRGEETSLTGVTIIVVMVALSGLLRFWQEFRTNRAAQALKSLVRTTATVLRRNEDEPVQEVPMSDLVPGDVVLLTAGDRVPADVRLLSSRDLLISQSILTGEALPVEKGDAALTTSENVIELRNICLMGSNVASGNAKAVVVATGAATWFGSLATSLVGKRKETAFDRGVNSVSRLLIRFMLVMVPVVMLINGVIKGEWIDATLFALAVAVGLTPEMLPMIVSSNLAKGAMAMARRKVIVKQLNAIQNLGAMDVLCTDKTGTLTQDHIVLSQHLDCHGEQNTRVLLLAWLNSNTQSGSKNLMDRAVVAMGKQHIAPAIQTAFQQLDVLPFDFTRRRLSVLVEDTQQHLTMLICKGAVDEMLAVTTHWRDGDAILPLDDTRRAAILAQTHRYNQQGFRVLLVASRTLESQRSLCCDDEQGLTLEGILTFLDPPKESAQAAIKALHSKGVAVKVLTGDNAQITAHICQDVGLDAQDIVTGEQIERMNDGELHDATARCNVFARLTPTQKSRVVKMLQQQGHTVGFLGDGVNDAPALRDADVGISVDGATDIARESSEIILLEKDLRVLEQGVLIGRETFGNIIKYLNMTASSNFGNVFSVLVASALIPFLPMLAIHLLIQNLMYDVSQLALPWDKMDNAFLNKPRKWDANNIKRFMVWMGPTSSLFDIATFALMWFVFAANHSAAQSLFQSGWFVEGLLSQTLVVHMLRTRQVPFIQSRAALPVMLTTLSIMALGIYLPFSPLGTLVGLVPLPWHYFPWLAAILLSYCLVAQGMKMIYIRRFGQWF